MKLDVNFLSAKSADGVYKITAKGAVVASLHWADANGILTEWTPFAYVPVLPNGTGIFRYTGGRAVPEKAEYILVRAVTPDFLHTDEVMYKIPDEQKSGAVKDGIKFCLMSDLHLSNKPWKIKQALSMAADADCVLIAGDLVNDGTQRQFQMMSDIIDGYDKMVFAVSGNHDYPLNPVPCVGEGIYDYYSLQRKLLGRAAENGCDIEFDISGAYAARMGDIEIIGLNAAAHWRRLTFKKGSQLEWLEDYIDKRSAARWRIILCHAPLIMHNPQRPKNGTPYLGRDKALQKIIDSNERIIFASGHTHISPGDYMGCVEYDSSRQNIYINDGSICPTTYKSKEPLSTEEWTDGIVTELVLGNSGIEISAKSVKSGQYVSRGHYRIIK